MAEISLVEGVRIAFALVVPWLAGMLWVGLALPAGSPGRWTSAIGFGYPVGTLFVIATILGQRALGWEHEFVLTLGIVGLAGFSGLVWLQLKERKSELLGFTSCSSLARFRGLSWPTKGLILGLCALIFFKLLLILQEIWLRPLFPWDAWNLHAQQARIWAEHGILVEFTRSWWAGPAGNPDSFYVQFAFDLHPPGLSLVQFWMIEALSRFDDAMINLPWFALGVSLCLALYGQIRMHGATLMTAVLAVYAMLSLPILHTHLALGGYADIWMGAYLLLAVAALSSWLSRPRYGMAMLALAGLAGLLVMKQSGLFWLPVVLAGFFGAVVGLRWTIIVLVIGIGGLLGVQFGLDSDIVGQFTSRRLAEATPEFSSVMTGLERNLFSDANWHFLWYLVPVVLVIALSLKEFRTPPRLSLTVTVVLGLASLLYAFFFTRAGDWVIQGTTVNRVLLHLVPVIIFWGALCLESAFQRISRARSFPGQRGSHEPVAKAASGG